MTWVAVAIGGAALVGGAASYMGSKKQSDAASDAANLSQGQFATNNAQQQPYIQSGYGALSRLNTLMGIGGIPTSQSIPPDQQKTIQPIPSTMTAMSDPRPSVDSQNPQLRQLLAIRAQHGDAQAGQLMKMVV